MLLLPHSEAMDVLSSWPVSANSSGCVLLDRPPGASIVKNTSIIYSMLLQQDSVCLLLLWLLYLSRIVLIVTETKHIGIYILLYLYARNHHTHTHTHKGWFNLFAYYILATPLLCDWCKDKSNRANMIFIYVCGFVCMYAPVFYGYKPDDDQEVS